MSTPYTDFLQAQPFALVGASDDPEKYGNIILKNLRGHGYTVMAVNPKGGVIEGQPAYTSLSACPVKPGLAVLVVPPKVGVKVVEEAHALGIEHVWLQPGADGPEVIERAKALGLKLVDDACIMVIAARVGA